MITTVAFDADDTLVHTRNALNAGLTAVAAALDEPSLTFDVLWSDGKDAWATIPERPAPEIRGRGHTTELGAGGT